MSIAEAIEAERYWTPAQYAQALGKTERWVEDHCVRYGDIHFSRVGRDIRFSRRDRAKNEALFAVDPLDGETESPAPAGFQLPTDPAELSKLLADVRRVQVPQHA